MSLLLFLYFYFILLFDFWFNFFNYFPLVLFSNFLPVVFLKLPLERCLFRFHFSFIIFGNLFFKCRLGLLIHLLCYLFKLFLKGFLLLLKVSFEYFFFSINWFYKFLLLFFNFDFMIFFFLFRKFFCCYCFRKLFLKSFNPLLRFIDFFNEPVVFLCLFHEFVFLLFR